MKNLKSISTIAFACLGSQLTAQENFLLGSNYVEGGFQYSQLEDVLDTYAFDLGVNYNVISQDKLGVDVYIEGLYSRDNEEFIDSKSYSLAVGANLFYKGLGVVRPFIGASISHDWVRGDSGDDDFFSWDVTLGLEYNFMTDFSLTPFVSYGDSFDSDGVESTTIGASLNYWITSNFSVSLGYAYHYLPSSLNADSIRVGVRYGF